MMEIVEEGSAPFSASEDSTCSRGSRGEWEPLLWIPETLCRHPGDSVRAPFCKEWRTWGAGQVEFSGTHRHAVPPKWWEYSPGGSRCDTRCKRFLPTDHPYPRDSSPSVSVFYSCSLQAWYQSMRPSSICKETSFLSLVVSTHIAIALLLCNSSHWEYCRFSPPPKTRSCSSFVVKILWHTGSCWGDERMQFQVSHVHVSQSSLLLQKSYGIVVRILRPCCSVIEVSTKLCSSPWICCGFLLALWFWCF